MHYPYWLLEDVKINSVDPYDPIMDRNDYTVNPVLINDDNHTIFMGFLDCKRTAILTEFKSSRLILIQFFYDKIDDPKGVMSEDQLLDKRVNFMIHQAAVELQNLLIPSNHTNIILTLKQQYSLITRALYLPEYGYKE